MTRRVLSSFLFVALAVIALVVAAGSERPAPTAAARAERIAKELRCPVCQGLSVADSPSETARDIRADIRRRIDAGESDAEIRQAYVERFGQWVLLRPKSSGLAALVWALPVLAFVLGASGLVVALRRWHRRPALRPSEEDRALVASLLRQREVGEERW